MTIRHFRIFLAAASAESITKAAEKLYLSQPAVSVAIRELVRRPLLFRERSSRAYEVFLAAVSQAGYTAEPTWESVSQEALIEAACHGLGTAVLPGRGQPENPSEKD